MRETLDAALDRAARALAHRVVLVALAAAPLALLGMVWWTPADWLPNVIGRFHPLVVHFPIGLLLAAGAAELWRVARGPRAGGGGGAAPLALLFAGAASAVAATVLGLLLRRGEGAEGALVEWHLVAGLTVAAGALAALALAPDGTGAPPRPRGRRLVAYRGALFGACAAVAVAGHLGASLTHGEEYLTEWLPEDDDAPAVAELRFPDSLPPDEWRAYEHGAAPILEARCAGCHNPRTMKGRLDLSDWDGLHAGGKSGPALAPGDADRSRLVQRMLLPRESKEHMPPSRKPQPRPDEIEFLKQWIAAGAPREGTLAELGAGEEWLQVAARLPGRGASRDSAAASEDVPLPAEIDEDAVARLRAPQAAAVAELQRRFPGTVGYESRASAALHMNASLFGSRFGDAELAALAPVAAQIVWLDLTGTAVTDRAAPQLARMARLRTLRLGATATGDATVAALAGLTELETLSLYRTAVTPAAAAQLARYPALRRLYAAETALPTVALLGDSTRRETQR